MQNFSHICPGFHQNYCHVKMAPNTSQEKRRTAILVQSSHQMSVTPHDCRNRWTIACSQAVRIASQKKVKIIPRPRSRSIDETKYDEDFSVTRKTKYRGLGGIGRTSDGVRNVPKKTSAEMVLTGFRSRPKPGATEAPLGPQVAH